jgi:uncharacterized protein (TIGR04255 family)
LTDALEVQVVPAGGAHAIEMMALAVDWSKPLSPEEQQSIRSIYEQSEVLRKKLPKLTPVGGFRFQVVQAPKAENDPQFSFETGGPGGLDLQCFRSDGKIAWAIALRPDFIACQCTVYDGWQIAKSEALSLLNPFLKTIFLDSSREIAGFGLQYQDAFLIKGDPSRFSMERMLIRRPNKLLPESVFDHTSLWHVHQGWFSRGPNDRRVLNIVNLDYAEANPDRVVRLSGQHRTLAMSYDGGARPLDLPCLPDALDHMHKLNKEVLSATLLDSVLKRIGLQE